MEKRFFTIVIFCIGLCLIANKAVSQCSTNICTDPVASFDAPSACILPGPESLNCYFGEMINSTPISLPPYWCTTVENNQWFAFTATSPNVSIDISALNCSSGGAIQAALLETVDCINFNFVSDCLGNIASGVTQTIVNNVPLQIGQVYYLMLDGSAGASCQYVINGANNDITGAEEVCLPSPSQLYFTDSPSTWSITPSTMGNILGSTTAESVAVLWQQTGTAQICAQSISCPNVPMFCKTVTIGESVIQTNTVYLCAGDVVECGGEVYSSGGVYTVNIPGAICDTIINCIVIPLPPHNMVLGNVPLPCEGIFKVCGTSYSSLGSYQAVCTNWQGCDSTIYFNLVAGDVLADAGPDKEITCATSQVTLDASGASQGGNFTYQWTTTDGHIVAEQPTSAIVDAAGTYCLTVVNTASGCVMTDCATVTLSQAVPVISIAPATAPCDGGSINLSATASPDPFVFFSWSSVEGNIIVPGNSSTPYIMNAGTYCVTVTDLVSCTASKCIEVDDKVQISIDGPTVFCTDQGSLTHTVNTFTSAFYHELYLQVGNAAPQMIPQTDNQASYAWTNTFTEPTLLRAWASDFYGCSSDTISFFVNDNQASLLLDQYQTECNSTTLTAQLTGNVPNSMNNWQWSNGSTNSQTIVTDNGWYFVTATDNFGCQWMDSVFATIDFAGNCAYIAGDVLLSANGSCQSNPNDSPAIGYLVRAEGTSGTFYATTDSAGHYFMPVDVGTYTVSVLLQAGNMIFACANDQVAAVPNIGDNANIGFLLQQPLNCPLLTVNIGAPFLRRCFTNTYHVGYCNLGTGTATDAYVELTLDPSIVFTYSSVPAFSLGNNSYRFELGHVAPSECGIFTVQGSIACNTDLGQLHCSAVHIYPDTLCNPQQVHSFEDEDCQVNIGSYDPNDLTANPPGTGTLHKVEGGTLLTYRVRFQNIGTDTAFQVVVIDSLPDAFEFETLSGGASSAPYSMELYGQRVLKFTFDGIKLPPVGTDEIGSTGFVEFNIRLRPDLAPLSTVVNQATIYFDFNEPVVTNTYFHTITGPPINIYQSASICEGSSYLFNGQALDLPGDYTASFTTPQGCDSIVHLSLVVVPILETTIEAGFCEGEPYSFNGQSYTQPGDYKFTLTNWQGCDSIVNLSLEVWPSYEDNFSAAICTGASYDFQGQTLTQPGNYQVQLSSVHGCDSTINLALTVTDIIEVQASDAICEGDTLAFGGQLLTVPGIFTSIFESFGGCDSIVTLSLTVLPTDTFYMDISICEGESYAYNNEILTVEGSYVFQFPGQNSCDSLVVLNLVVAPIEHSSMKAFICEGDTLIIEGQEYSTPGMYEIMVNVPNDCPEFITLYLEFYPTLPVTEIEESVIEGTVFNGVLILSDTVFTEELTDENGCDSIVNYSITALPNATHELAAPLNMEVFPNPSLGDFQLQFQLTRPCLANIKVVDVTGRLVRELPETYFATGSHSVKISAADWSSGIYFLQFSSDFGQFLGKVVKVERGG